jgi:DNA-binding response OmpR family regulator
MPELDGLQLADMLREDTETHHIPIIFLSALLSPEVDRDNPHHLGGETFIAKPFHYGELLSEVRKILDSRTPSVV